MGGRYVIEIHESGEDYLETILVIKNNKGSVRAIDIAKARHFSKPSVSRAVSVLREQGYVDVIDGKIELTQEGRQIAEDIYEKHQLLMAMLMRLGVDEETAAMDACKIEHTLSPKTFACLKAHFKEK